ncbi:hypothetical protein [Dactylosporangium sp. NPDC005555]|uniref:hypothetical protein n=1 Tax=Dactylosporangium sp. NPDC005555 TaxID=3154889 RepID=UPI0033BCF688
MDSDMTAVLLDALKRAADAHHLHEAETGTPDADWPAWYAAHMTATLRAAGYRLTAAGAVEETR